ncbi:hypothetical protein [Nitrosopumilus ureiphilus]|uniref:Uncharacterized protein n=1 Tax=Nitrosopumilus ureiphilus TaxID=1470067 RepID=A0A7D5R4C7_9ARCH|nr:hypothetical protein [Nitrosopumilus ureiphilus]QLH07620.1 hypothetical protein C5F50_11470 [Nitrosopumilus ureiphilus]
MHNSKLSASLFVLTSVLFTIGFVPYLTLDAFAAQPTISAYVANDPDDADTVFSAGDTLTITTNIATNATVGAVTSAAFVTGNFTFASPDPLASLTFTTDWTAEWTNNQNLVITFININNVPVVGASTVDVSGTNSIGDLITEDPDPGMAAGSQTLSGDFGLFVAATVTTNGGSGCNGDCEEPTLGVDNDGRRIVDNGFTYNGNPIDVERYFTPYPLVTVNVGKQNVAEFKIYENLGPDKISHFELAFGLAKGESIGMSKAVINWDKTFDGIETVTLDDPENVLDKISVTTSEGYCSDESQTKCLIVKVAHTFRAPLDFNILGTNVWDAEHNAWQNYYNHGIEVVGPSMNPPKEYDGINKGHIYHLTETSKTSAVDEFGNSWSLKYDQWEMDYVLPDKIQDPPTQIMTRLHSDFTKYKEDQIPNAIEQLLVLCPTCLTSYADFEDSFSFELPERINKLDNPEIQSKMKFESERAQQVIEHLLAPSLHHQQ